MTPHSEVLADGRCATAITEAYAAVIEEVSEARVGAHLEVIADAERVVTHLFEAHHTGYVGWRWAVTLARADGSDDISIDEIVLLPGPDSLLAPKWVPWQNRVQAGDLGVGDVLPAALDDARLVPGYTGADLDTSYDDALYPVGWELGLGRVRVLSLEGRDQAAERWIDGENGPGSPIAKAATDQCSTCGFLIPVNGPLGRAFGLCGNEFSPADGRVVALDFGCGAHSEAESEPPPVTVVELVVDDLSPDLLDTTPAGGEEPHPPVPAQIDEARADEKAGTESDEASE